MVFGEFIICFLIKFGEKQNVSKKQYISVKRIIADIPVIFILFQGRYRDGSPSLTLSEVSHVPTSSTGTVSSSPYPLPAMPSPIARARGSFPNESNPSLKIDLSQLKQPSSNKPRSQSSTSTPRRQEV